MTNAIMMSTLESFEQSARMVLISTQEMTHAPR